MADLNREDYSKPQHHKWLTSIERITVNHNTTLTWKMMPVWTSSLQALNGSINFCSLFSIMSALLYIVMIASCWLHMNTALLSLSLLHVYTQLDTTAALLFFFGLHVVVVHSILIMTHSCHATKKNRIFIFVLIAWNCIVLTSKRDCIHGQVNMTVFEVK